MSKIISVQKQQIFCAGGLTLGVCLLLCINQVDAQGIIADERGAATVFPTTAAAGTCGTWHVIYTVGSDGMQAGGGVKTQFPNGWHFYRSLQTGHPHQANYVSVSVSRPGVSISTTVQTKQGLDGQQDRHDRTVAVIVDGQDLLPGDVITVTYGDTSGGGAGISAPVTTGIDEILVASDTDGDGIYGFLDNLPQIVVESKPAYCLTVIAPSQVQADLPFTINVAATGQHWNPARSFTGTINFSCSDPQATLPSAYTFRGPTDGGYLQFSVTLHTPGIQAITITESQLAAGGVASNPIVVYQERPQPHLYWGDLHSHSEFSFDGLGHPERAFEQARHVRSLDFYALTDHDGTNSTTGLTPWEWDRTLELVEAYYNPGEFVTFPAFEWTAGLPHGHHNVFFQNPQEATVLYHQQKNPHALAALWAALADKRIFSIPHHTGIRWDISPGYLDWYSQDDLLRPIVEIYSLHGSSEYYGNPMAYEMFWPNVQSQPGPHYVRDAWERGLYLGVIASSDDHTCHPGLPHLGLAAVYAEELTRDALFEAILNRHTYATTGERIVLNFGMDGHLMGERYRATGPPEIKVSVVGTDELQFVELVKYDGITWTTAYSLSMPLSSQASFSHTDTTLARDSLYYVRVRQVNEVRDRPVMAWSSPIWVYTSSLVAIHPSTKVAGQGVPFTVTVDANIAHNLGGFLFDLVYDPNVLQGSDAGLGPFLGSTGRTVFSPSPVIDNQVGRTRYGAFSNGGQPGPDGTGALTVVTMTAQITGTTILTLERVQLWDTLWNSQTVKTATVQGARVVIEHWTRLYLPLILRGH